MRYWFIALLLLLSSTILASHPRRIQQMRGFPKQEQGYEKGVSACYGGYLNDYLIMAGGCNFPDIPAAQGGKKKYYQGIYAARVSSSATLHWKKVGNLPVEAAYGVSISTENGIFCIGGNNNQSSIQSVFKIQWDKKGKDISIESLPSLPYSLDNMTGSFVGNYIIVAGGNCDCKPSNRAFCLNLKSTSEGWKELPSFPDAARVQPISACLTEGGRSYFYLMGGYQPKRNQQKAVLSLDAFRYSLTEKKWEKVSSPFNAEKENVFLGGAVATSLNNHTIICLGGCNKDIFESALNNPQSDYLTHPESWYKFNPYILIYQKNDWKELTRSSQTAKAGATLVKYKKQLFLIGGEVKPGIRSASIYRIIVD